MEVVDVLEQARKYLRQGNRETKKVGQRFVGGEEVEGVVGINGELCNWQNSSRIIRNSRASGGKDRHSKVWTSKGPRDRRVRLSVSTAIQFYDLQDRLGYDHPSQAVEWLIKAASDAISNLPTLNASFPVTPTQITGERKKWTEMKVDDGVTIRQKLACSSQSESRKGSAGLSLCQSKTRMKKRERTEKNDYQKFTPLSISPFTKLLTGGDSARLEYDDEHSFFLPSSAVEYFSPAIKASWCSGQICHLPPTMTASSVTSMNGNQAEMLYTEGRGNIPTDFNRGPLQSNWLPDSPHLPTFASIDGQNSPSWVRPAATSDAPSPSIFRKPQLQLESQNSTQEEKGET